MTNYSELFLTVDNIYLLNHSVGLVPEGAQQALSDELFSPWRAGREDVWPCWLQSIDKFRQSLATLLNARPDNFCPQTNLSSGFSKLLGALPRSQSRDTVLLSEDDFPSMAFVAQQFGNGVKVKFIPKDSPLEDAQFWAQQLDDNVFATLITHVQSNTGQQLPVGEICTLTKSRGIFSIVDIAQSAGIIPIDLQQWHADAVLGSCVKWLCGGPGAGYMWVNPELLQQCKPVDVGWFSHANPFEFDPHHFEYADSALRFWGGTPSVAPFIIARHSIDILASIGVDSIRHHNNRLREQLHNGIPDKFYRSPSDNNRCGGTVILHTGAYQDSLVRGLREANILHDERAEGVRLSPHIYNTDAEIKRLINIVSDL